MWSKSAQGAEVELGVLHYWVGQQGGAGFFYCGLCGFSIGRIQLEGNVLANANILHLFEAQVSQSVLNGFALRIE